MWQKNSVETKIGMGDRTDECVTQGFDVDYDQILVEATDLSWVKCSFPRSKILPNLLIYLWA